MKLSILMAVLLLAGCAKSPQTKAAATAAPTTASVTDCDRVYGRMLAIAVATEVDPDHTFNDAQNLEALSQVDEVYTQRGNKATWYQACVGHANSEQIECMSNANDLEGMGLCAHLFNHPKTSR